MNREIILHIHSILGVVVFVTGFLQILLKKEGSRHRIIGQIYVSSWLLLLISGAFLTGLAITIVGVFGFYFALTGSRIGRLKNKEITWFEKSIFLAGGLSAIVLIYYSVSLYLKGQQSWPIILAVFGGLFLWATSGDIFKYILKKPFQKQKYGKSDWIFEHFTRMSISFIAAVTAFTSIQNVFQNNTLNFLLPTAVGIILIRLTTKSYTKKLLK
jgi:uncharacterized membrane protein YozB (DUF420 family)